MGSDSVIYRVWKRGKWERKNKDGRRHQTRGRRNATGGCGGGRKKGRVRAKVGTGERGREGKIASE